MDKHLDDLARQFLAADKQEQNVLWPCLEDSIQNLARLLATADRPALRDEFVADAPTKVWEKLNNGMFDPKKASFRTWVRTLLDNDRVDRLRNLGRRKELIVRYAETLRFRSDESRDLADSPFDGGLSPRDLETIRGWKARIRLHLGVVSNFWWHLPEEMRRGTLQELDLSADAIPDVLMELDSKPRKNAFLAELFGVTKGCICTWYQRTKRFLMDLDYLKGRV